jgi:hypothetical protein
MLPRPYLESTRPCVLLAVNVRFAVQYLACPLSCVKRLQSKIRSSRPAIQKDPRSFSGRARVSESTLLGQWIFYLISRPLRCAQAQVLDCWNGAEKFSGAKPTLSPPQSPIPPQSPSANLITYLGVFRLSLLCGGADVRWRELTLTAHPSSPYARPDLRPACCSPIRCRTSSRP